MLFSTYDEVLLPYKVTLRDMEIYTRDYETSGKVMVNETSNSGAKHHLHPSIACRCTQSRVLNFASDALHM